MDLIADRGRRVTVEELNTTRLLAHARKQAVQRKFDDMLIVDVRRPSLRERALPRDPPVHGERRLQAAGRMGGRGQADRGAIVPTQGRLHPGHGRPRHALSAASLGEDRARQAPRRPARRALDGRDERRLFLPVPDRHAQYRPASAEGDGGRAVLGLQPLAHREGAAGVGRPLLLHAVPAVLRSGRSRCATSRPSATASGVDRLHGDDGAQPAGQRQRLYEGLSRDARSAAWRSPFHSGPNWNEPVFRACNRFLSVHALGFTFYNILHLHQLGHQRHGRALSQAAGDLDRVRARLGAVPDAAARPRIHAAPVGGAAAEEEADRTTCATCTTRRSRWRFRTCEALEMHVPHDQCGDAAALFLGLSALGLRPADRRSTTCRSCPRRPSTTFSAAPRRGCSSCRRATTSRRRT